MARVEAAQEALRSSFRQTKVMVDDADKLVERHELGIVRLRT